MLKHAVYLRLCERTSGGYPMRCGGFWAAVLVGSALVASAHATPALYTLGRIESTALDVSADGTVVTGQFGGGPGFLWVVGQPEYSVLPSLSASSYSTGTGISSDGAVIAGRSQSDAGFEGFRWTAADGSIGVGDLAGGFFSSSALDMSGDGDIVVGQSTSASGTEAFKWTQSGGIEGLGDLADGVFSSAAYGISRDGSTIVGVGRGALGRSPVRWVSGGIEALSGFALNPFTSDEDDGAYAASADGSIIAGVLRLQAFRWTEDGGPESLGVLPGEFMSRANAMSDDGETIVGSSGYMSSQRAILWDEQHGMRRLQDLLIQEGVDLRGYTLTSANGISADGRVIVGSAQTTTGAREAFVAVIPEPNLAVTVGSVAALLLRRRTRRQQGAS